MVDSIATDPPSGWSEDDLDIEVSVADSVASANCAMGTFSWVSVHLREFGVRRKAPIRQVLQAARNSPNVFPLVERACRRAVDRHKRLLR